MKSTLLLAQKRRGIVWPVYWRLLFHQWECGRFCVIFVWWVEIYHCRGATASGRSREVRARQSVRAGKLQDKTRARLKKRAWKEKARRR